MFPQPLRPNPRFKTSPAHRLLPPEQKQNSQLASTSVLDVSADGPHTLPGSPRFSIPASLTPPGPMSASTVHPLPITPIWLHHLYLPQNLVCNGPHVVESKRYISVLLLSFSDPINPAGDTHFLVRFWALGLLHITSSCFSLSWPHLVVSSAGSACSPGLLNTRIPRGPGMAPHFSALSP